MANTDLNVIIRLSDQISGPLQKVSGRIQEIGQQVERVGTAISRTGMKMAFVGAFITAPFAVAAKDAAIYSPAVMKSLDQMQYSMARLSVSVSESVLPILQKLANGISNLVNWFNRLDPAVRNMILQWTLISGIVLTVGGIILKVAGSIIYIVGKISTAMNPWILALLLVSGAIILMVQNWEKVRTFIMPWVTKLQIAIDMLAIGWYKVALGMTHVLALGASMVGQLDLATYFESQAIILEQTIAGIEDDMAKAMSGQGWANAMDSGIQSIQNMWAKIQGIFNNGVQNIKMQMFNTANFIKDIARQIAGAMEQSLGNFFYNVLTNQLSSAEEAFQNFGQAVMQILTQAIAKLILFFTIGRLLEPTLGFNMFGTYHQGGVVKRAHTGTMIGQDEVPIIAQAGEGIISRKGMSALGKGNFDRLNRGEGGGSSSGTNVYYIITAVDSKSFANMLQSNEASIHQILENNLRKNGRVRQAIRQYA